MKNDLTLEILEADIEKQIKISQTLAVTILHEYGRDKESLRRTLESCLGIAGRIFVNMTYKPNDDFISMNDFLNYLADEQEYYQFKMLHSAWENNFALARNQVKTFCEAADEKFKFQLSLDDDEMIFDPEYKLLSILNNAPDEVGAFLINIRDIKEGDPLGNKAKLDMQCRIYRSGLGKWKTVVHESILESIVQEGKTISVIEGPEIWHYGYSDLRSYLNKLLRNMDLLEYDIKNSGNPDYGSYYFLAKMFQQFGFYAEANERIAEAMRLVPDNAYMSITIYMNAILIALDAGHQDIAEWRAKSAIEMENSFVQIKGIRGMPYPRIVLGDICYLRHEYSKALSYWNDALKFILDGCPQAPVVYPPEDIKHRIETARQMILNSKKGGNLFKIN